MHARSTYLALGALALTAEAIPHSRFLTVRQSGNNTAPACLPQNDPNPDERAAGVSARDEGYVYGPSLIGEAAPFPNGTLGNARHEADMKIWSVDREEIDARIAVDLKAVEGAIVASGGLNTTEAYAAVLYDEQWKESNPRSTAPGIMTNYTQDLLFSMERLSQNPYSLMLVDPEEELPFELDDELTGEIAGATLEELQTSGNLFYVDYSHQETFEKTPIEPKRYGAACSAYFFIHPESGDFLPLAIKTNIGADLIYTPLDEDNDWMLAKMMFNVNDMFHSQMLHLVITHDVSEGVHQAALHTLSDNHPIMVVLDRLMLQGYSSRIVGEELCFNPGGHWDQLMYVSNVGCRDYVTESWPTAGKFQAGYLHTDLKARGLINDNNEYPFKEFPFFQDADAIQQAYKAFFQSFIDSYYESDDDVAADFEVQDWFAEATANAKVHDFPEVSSDEPVNKEVLIDVLTHFGFIVSVGHHALNGGDPVGSKATLPFHLPALHAPIPEEKGVTDLMPFLPDAKQAVHYIAFIASFNRPFYETSERTLENAFSAGNMLQRLNDATKEAADTFLSSMQDLSEEVRSRGFDEDGLSMGMPFVYRTLDPGYIPFFCSV